MNSGEYLQLVAIIERLHRQFLEVKLELEHSGVHDINNVQAVLLFNRGLATYRRQNELRLTNVIKFAYKRLNFVTPSEQIELVGISGATAAAGFGTAYCCPSGEPSAANRL